MRHASEQPREKKKGRTAAVILLSVFIIGFCFGAFMLIKTLLTAAHEQETFDGLSKLVKDTDEKNGDGALQRYEDIYEKNPDFFGWLKIGGTKIDYPVMYTPRDTEYYIHRDFYGSYSESGMLFIDGECPADGNFYLIYGHHMHNGAMFGELPLYRDRDFYEAHKTVCFDTRYETREYEVVAAMYAEVYDRDDEEGRFCYYHYKNLSSEAVFQEYVANIKANAVYETGITPVYGDELITLSTCSYHTENGRFIVVARRIGENKG